jgi:hypothetical protein
MYTIPVSISGEIHLQDPPNLGILLLLESCKEGRLLALPPASACLPSCSTFLMIQLKDMRRLQKIPVDTIPEESCGLEVSEFQPCGSHPKILHV